MIRYTAIQLVMQTPEATAQKSGRRAFDEGSWYSCLSATIRIRLSAHARATHVRAINLVPTKRAIWMISPSLCSRRTTCSTK